MAMKGYDEDSLLPLRDRKAGQEAISSERALEQARERESRHESIDVPQRQNQGHPDGYRNNR